MKSISEFILESTPEVIRTEVEWIDGITLVDYTNSKLSRHRSYNVKKLDSYLKKVGAPQHITLNYDYDIDSTNPINYAARIQVIVKAEDREGMRAAIKNVKSNYGISAFDEIFDKRDNTVSFLFDNSK